MQKDLNMKVEFTKLQRSYEQHAEEYDQAALRVLRSGWYILGHEMEAFEDRFAEYLGVRYCIGVNSGMDALILAVRALGIGPGDEVIVPANTYIASVLGVTENGATPIFVEPDEFMNLDPQKIEDAISDRTKAILPVHLYGQPCRMDSICEIASRHRIPIIEDCAQSHGATFADKKTGTFGQIGCFSFYPTKPLGAMGDAGTLVTDDKALAERLRMLRNYGSRKKYINEIEGVNSRLDEMQAAILGVGLTYLDEGNRERQRIAQRYLSQINCPKLQLPKTAPGATHVYHQFPILCDKRDELQAFLLDEGIQTLIHYPVPPHLAECYRRLGYREGDYPLSERYAREELSLPIYSGLTEPEIDYILAAINSY